ncbi:hypothetical protein ACP4OV_024238 [Aristida adscensionis]
MMEAGHLVMEAHAEGVDGFPSLLRKMMWDANLTCIPEYRVYARCFSNGMVDYIATVDIVEPQVYAARFHDLGTSVEMAIQFAAFTAMAGLRRDFAVVLEGPFTYFPIASPQNGVNIVLEPKEGASFFEWYAAKMVAFYDRMIRCVRHETWETRRRIRALQDAMDESMRGGDE